MQVKINASLPTATFIEKLSGKIPTSLRQKVRFIVHPDFSEFAILTDRTGVFFDFHVTQADDHFHLWNPGHFVNFEKDEASVDRAIKLIWDNVRDYLNIAAESRKLKPIVAYENTQSLPIAKMIEPPLSEAELEVERYKANLIRFKAMSQMGNLMIALEDA